MRDRSWRRKQRSNKITSRAPRRPDDQLFKPKPVWQAFMIDGKALPMISHAAPIPEVDDLRIYAQINTLGECSYHTTLECCCSNDYYSRCFSYNRFPALPAGFYWQFVRMTDPEPRCWMTGKFNKVKTPHSHKKFVKNWKFLYTRHVKVKRARQLGRDLMNVEANDE